MHRSQVKQPVRSIIDVLIGIAVYFLFVALTLSFIHSAGAEELPDLAFLQRAIVAIEQQRNGALTAQAVAEAKLALANESLSNANAKIKELESMKNNAENKK